MGIPAAAADVADVAVAGVAGYQERGLPMGGIGGGNQRRWVVGAEASSAAAGACHSAG